MVVPILLVLAACSRQAETPAEGPQSTDGAAGLEDVSWVLDPASATSLSATAPADARVDLVFETRMAHGLSACNTYRGDYTLDGASLSFGALAVTQMACAPEVSDLETAYLAALDGVTGFAVTGNTLVLSGDGADLSFSAEKPVSLTGTLWNANTIGNPQALTGVLTGTQPTAEFSEDGTVSGTDGCNRYHGTYTVEGDTLSVGKLAISMMACEPDVSQQASDFTAALEGATTFTVDGTSLVLFADDGRMLLVFSSA